MDLDGLRRWRFGVAFFEDVVLGSFKIDLMSSVSVLSESDESVGAYFVRRYSWCWR